MMDEDIRDEILTLFEELNISISDAEESVYPDKAGDLNEISGHVSQAEEIFKRIFGG